MQTATSGLYRNHFSYQQQSDQSELMTTLLLTSLAMVMALMTCLWLVSLARRDASIVDPFWGVGFIVVASFAILSWPVSEIVARSWWLFSLTSIWGMRLAVYLLWRNWGHAEDRRYRAMRDHHGARFWWVSFFTVFVLQGMILWIVSLPIQVGIAKASTNPLAWLDFTGILLWSVGIFFESVGDLQMAKFLADPSNAGKVMDRGLWGLTRHPNYFGDFCVWWGLYLVATSGGAWWTIFSPMLMSLLLLRVSGVTLLEKNISERRPEYLAYQARTSPFFPWPSSTITGRLPRNSN